MFKRLTSSMTGLLATALVCAGIFWPTTVHASVNDFVINSFVADYTLSRDDKQGHLDITEDIDLTFGDYNHGILRAIPNTYKGHKLNLKVKDLTSNSGAPAQFTTYQSNGNTVLKIGDPNKTVTGKQHYRIQYALDNVIAFYDDHTELYWDINGTEWQQPFDSVLVTLHFADAPLLTDRTVRFSVGGQSTSGLLQPTCYTGGYGDTSQRCQIAKGQGEVAFRTSDRLLAGGSLTILVPFDNGYFAKSTWLETLREYSREIVGYVTLPILIGGWALYQWLRYGRDGKGRGVIVPQYEPPEGLLPIEAGGLVDFRSDNRDITATIIDLAVRGYIRIVETKVKKRLARDKTEYSFILLNSDTSDLKPVETKMLTAMFPELTINDVSDLKSLQKNKFYSAVAAMKVMVNTSLTSEGYYRANPAKSAGKMWVVATVLFLLVHFLGGILGVAYVVGAVAALFIAIGFAVVMPARTSKGTLAREQVEGLKLYMEVAEKDRLQMMQSPKSPYAEAPALPQKTVKLFEKLLPYAVALGVEKEWAKQFESLYVTPPDWYSGNWTTFNSFYLANSITSGMAANMNSAFSAPSSSGGSGFSSGGGFSGGGGGGGGGGGW